MCEEQTCTTQPRSQQHRPSTVSFAKVWPKDLLLGSETSRKPKGHGHLYSGPQKPGVPLKTRQHRKLLSFYVPTSCHRLGAWTMDASYQSTDKQKFKAPFDMKESSEDMWRPGGGSRGNHSGGSARRQTTCWGSHCLDHVQCFCLVWSG